jgi:hypothetical protein
VSNLGPFDAAPVLEIFNVPDIVPIHPVATVKSSVLLLMPAFIASKVKVEPASINNAGLATEVLKSRKLLVSPHSNVTSELFMKCSELSEMGDRPRSIVITAKELKITSSPAIGTPDGVQLPGVFQLPVAPPVHVLIAALTVGKLNRRRSNNKNLFIPHKVLGNRLFEKVFREVDAQQITDYICRKNATEMIGYDLWKNFRCYPSSNLATPNAAPAAAAPINATRNAPDQGLMPVILLLNQPNIKRQIRVTTTEIFNPSAGD